jgi:hypothetical protein
MAYDAEPVSTQRAVERRAVESVSFARALPPRETT